MPSPITNSWEGPQGLPRLPVERVFLYRPEQEWTYSHHPSLTWFGGRFLAIWSNGREHEDDVGQRVLLSASADFGTWTEPEPLVDSQPGQDAEAVLTAAGFHQHAGLLVAYFGRYEYGPECLEDGRRATRQPFDRGHRCTRLFALTSTDGQHWSGIGDLRLPLVPNHPPQATRSGRLILSGNVVFPYTDAPDGLSGWRLAGIYPPEMAGEVFDDSEGFWRVRECAGWEPGLCEGSFYQTDDGVLHMLLRSGQQRLWVTESGDDGETWSWPEPTAFTDCNTKFHFGRLPDGRFYYVGCPDPQGPRNPLVLSLSEDGVRFARHYVLADEPYARRRDGLHKMGEYGYPHTLLHDGWLCVIASRQKEAVEVLRTPLAQVA
ncbi:MAG: exo-alpha-sialidase [Candidatus Latescibacterota bacterium]